MTHHEKTQVTIIVEKTEYHVQRTLMSGSEIRALPVPPIAADRDLFREVPGPAPDQLVGDTDQVELKNGMHFYSVPHAIAPGATNPS